MKETKEVLGNLKHLRKIAFRGQFSPPENVKTVKARLWYRIFKVDYIRRMGLNYIGRFTGALPEIAGIYAIMKVFNIPTTPLSFGILMVAYLILTFLIGGLIVYHDLDLIESVIGIERNQFQKELYEKTLKKRDDL